jgi:hypothetical protein
MDLNEAKLRARHHAQSATKRRGGRPAPELDPAADGAMCRLLLMAMCRLDGDACEAWVFCHEEGCTDGPSFGADSPKETLDRLKASPERWSSALREN